MDRRKIDVVLSTLLILMSLGILTSDNLVEGGAETELSSMFLPRIVAVLIILFAGTIAIKSLRKLLSGAEKQSHEIIMTDGFSGIFLYIGIFVAYWFSVPYVGFMVATPFVMLSVAFLLGGRNWLTLIPLSIITPVLIYYGALNFLRVFLPTWTLS